MSDGRGCTCAARSESECCCDVDWTPQELIDARAEIERLTAELSKWHETSAEELNFWKKEAESLKAERDALKKALSKYGHHIDGCGYGWNCSCGFYELFRVETE